MGQRYVPDTMPAWPVVMTFVICLALGVFVDGGGLDWFFNGIVRFVGRIVLGF